MKACQKYNIKPIFGVEFYIVEDITKKEKNEKRSHITALVQNEEGWRNILKLITLSNIEGFYHKPRIDPKILYQNSKGIIWLSGCSATCLHYQWGLEFFKELSKHCEVYLEIMPHNFKEQIETNLLCYELSKKLSIPLVATQDSHYVYKEDSICQEVMLAVQSKQLWNDPNRWRFNSDDFYFKTKREMIQAFSSQNCLDKKVYLEAINNTYEIAKRIDFHEIKPKKISLPCVHSNNEKDIDFLKRLCLEGMKEKNLISKQEYEKRLEENRIPMGQWKVFVY